MQDQTGTRARVPLGVLDFGQLSAGQSSAQALADTTALACNADQLGYSRFWVSEHHAVPWLSSTSPAVLLGHLAANTRRVRVGSGGVMLSNHPPLVVAEQFALLEALYPGRVDLGMGRAPGADPLTAAALRRTTGGLGEEEFPLQVDQVLAALGVARSANRRLRSPQPVLSPTPQAQSTPAVWLLGGSNYSAELAGRLGLSFCFAAHNGTPARVAASALALYRDSFVAPRPGGGSKVGAYAMISASVVVAESDDEAARTARPGRLQRYAERTGRKVMPFMTAEDASQVRLSPADERAMAAMPTGGAIGDPEHAAGTLDALAATTGADEIVVCSFGQRRGGALAEPGSPGQGLGPRALAHRRVGRLGDRRSRPGARPPDYISCGSGPAPSAAAEARPRCARPGPAGWPRRRCWRRSRWRRSAD